MKERPILFSGPMVRAILDGSKTQTRRVVKPQPAGAWATPGRTQCPYGQPGDRLWVRETWHSDTADLDRARAQHEDALGGNSPIYYRADTANANCGMSWRPSIHMPRWASRITLEVASVRVERVQAISEDDVIAEGLQTTLREYDALCDLWHQFSVLWDTINAKRGSGWDANPWVWVIEFRRIVA